MAHQVLDPVTFFKGHVVSIELRLALLCGRLAPSHMDGLLSLNSAQQGLTGLADDTQHVAIGVADLSAKGQCCSVLITGTHQ